MGSLPFSDFPEDVQLCILSFLPPSDITTFACTSKLFLSLCTNDSKLWFTMCERRWGSKTLIKKWGDGKITFRRLYKALNQWESLIGFWRRIGPGTACISSPSLVFFEWGSSFITGSRVSPSKTGSYHVIKSPFLWISLSHDSQVTIFLDPEGRAELSGEVLFSGQFDFSENDMIPVNVSFMGKTHFVLEENMSFTYFNSPEQTENGYRRSFSSANLRGDDGNNLEEVICTESGSSPGSLADRLMSEVYQHFANRTSPNGDRASRRQRKKGKERKRRRKWEPKHFVKIVNCSPTPSKPLQGLWKGICHDMSLEFYLVVYDVIGGISCRRVGNSPERFSSYAPVFWTSNATFMDSTFSPEEENLYNSRMHLRPTEVGNHTYDPFLLAETEAVDRIIQINSSHDLVLPESPDLAGSTTNPWNVEGRIWQYNNGTFGFGFLCDNFIIDMKHIACHDHNLDILDI